MKDDMHRAQTVLIVDDNLDFAETLVLQLAQAGYRAVASGSARQALELLDADDTVGTVVTDVRMPGVDGLDFRRVLRHRFPKLPVVLMSGMPLDPDELPPSVAKIMQKPFSAAELIGVLLQLK